MLRHVAVVLVAGCGRLGFEASGGIEDAAGGIEDAAIVDPNDALACADRVFAAPGASSLTDDFTTGVITDRWAPVAPCIVQLGGALQASPSGVGVDYCHAWTAADYHLTCDRVSVLVATSLVPQLGAQTYLYVGSNRSPNLLLLQEGSLLTFGDGVQSASWPYDPVDDRWWQLRELGGELVVETSPDGLTWTERVRVNTMVPLDAVSIALGAGTYLPVTTPGSAEFRCYNVAPPCS